MLELSILVALANAVSFDDDDFFRIDLIDGMAGLADVDGDGDGAGDDTGSDGTSATVFGRFWAGESHSGTICPGFGGTDFGGTGSEEIGLIGLTGLDDFGFDGTNFSVLGFAAGISTILSLASDLFGKHEAVAAGDVGGTGFHLAVATFTVAGLGVGASEAVVAGDAGGTGFHLVAGTFPVAGLGVGASEENVPLSDRSTWPIGVTFGEIGRFSRVADRFSGKYCLTPGDFERFFRT